MIANIWYITIITCIITLGELISWLHWRHLLRVAFRSSPPVFSMHLETLCAPMCTNDPESFKSKFDHGGSAISPDPYAMLLIHKMKKKCTNEKNARTNNALTILRVLAQNSKMGFISFHQVSLWCFWYKHKRGCTNEKNTCIYDPETLGSKFKNVEFYCFKPSFDAFDIRTYKHKRSALTKNMRALTGTNNSESLGSKFKNWGSGEM